jgi:[ribosomal protein S5]-alanine N-acetyltransferase
MEHEDSLPPQESLPWLRTQRLVLRPMTLDDAADVFAYSADPAVLRYTTGTTPSRPEETQAWLEAALADSATHMWAILLRDSPTVIGAIEFGVPIPGSGSTHYALGRSHWGAGLMTEAVEAVCHWALDALPSMQDITTGVVAENVGSGRVLEKCGFERIGSIVEQWDRHGEPVTLHMYRRLRRPTTITAI